MTESLRDPSPLLLLPGAAPTEGPDAGVPAHYGDPRREQTVLERSVGFVDRSHRGLVAVPGADRLTWLHSVTSQALDRLAPATVVEALVLSPNGHLEHHAVVDDDGATTWLETEPGAAPALLDYLVRMRFMMRVEPSDVTSEWASLSVGGPGTAALLAPLLPGGTVPAVGAVVAGVLGGSARGADGPLPGQVDLRVPRASLRAAADLLLAAGAAPAGTLAYEALRIAAVRPRPGLDSDHRTLPHEVGMIGRAVHLDKGCYRGQETVARVQNLGRPPRRLVLLHLDGTEVELPVVGTEITAGARTVGVVGTSALHHELGPIALALVRRSLPDDSVLSVGPLAAAVDVDVTPAPVEEARERPADRLRAGLGPAPRA